jgi:hypothetical protein
VQYRNTLADLVAFTLAGDATSAKTVLGGAPLDEMPKDARASVPQDLHGAYRRMSQTVQQAHVEAAYDVGAQIGAALTTSALIGKTVGACATDTVASNDEACVTDFIKRFGARALRRPLTTDDVSFYKSVYASAGIDPAGLADVIAAMLGAPQFLYLVESGAAQVPNKPKVYQLSAFELASRLSYQFWDTMPDDELWKSAESGALVQDDATYAAQVDRLLASPRAHAGSQNFFREWLKLEDLKALNGLANDARFKAFSGTDLPDATLHQGMTDEVLAMTDYFTWTKPGGMRDLLGSAQSFAKAPNVARLYGVAPWDGVATPPPVADRPGLLTRAAFLASASGNTRPIMKGVFVRQSILCDTIPPPPQGANANPPMLSTELTTRQTVEALTEQKGTVCVSCHGTVINALGFATEGYDALGRLRTKQKLFDDKGTLVKEVPIDTQSVPHVTLDDGAASKGPADLVRLIEGSGKAEACIARQYFRYTFARWEDESADGCTLDRLRSAMSSDHATFVGFLREVALSPQFKQRAFD